MPSATTTHPSSSTSTSTSTSSSSSSAPALPTKPRTLKQQQVTNTNRPYATPAYPSTINRYGPGTLGSYAAAPYNRFGGAGTMYGAGYGGLYGGMGVGGYGYGGYQAAGGGLGPPGSINDPNSLTNSFNQSTQATFQIIESVVQAFGGFAQMLESTYLATHSSFFAMVQVAEQFGNLRNTLGSILGIFALLRWIRSFLAKLTGKPIGPSTSTSKDLITPSNFLLFQKQQQGRPTNNNIPSSSRRPPSPSKKPLLVFLLAVFGLPLIMGKLIRALASRHPPQTPLNFQQQQLQQQAQTQQQQQQQLLLDPSKLTFCRVMHDYTPALTDSEELAVKKGDLVAVVSKNDPLGQPSDWWRCRTRDARFGWLPSTYLSVVMKGDDGRIGSGGGNVAAAAVAAKEGEVGGGTTTTATTTAGGGGKGGGGKGGGGKR
ncbi:MAG: Peroxisomal membrane protein PAS20 [Peltula sp. TS41687]|nr:MAG: Peroxisomal membrane protein PAS20 [Peltula sp. TS41687]